MRCGVFHHQLLLLLQFLVISSLSASGSTSGRPLFAILHGMVMNSNTAEVSGASVDEQLYSRQLLVYGKSAQRRMQDAHVLVIGDSPLTDEIVKNLALAGVGRISIHREDEGDSRTSGTMSSPEGLMEWDTDMKNIDTTEEVEADPLKDKKTQQTIFKSKLRLLGEAKDLVSYAKGLNPYVKASYVDINIASSAENVYSVIIIIDSPFESTIDLQKAYPGIGKKAKVVSCGVQGVCGYIMNDFGDHVIEDADGEEVKETPLLSATILDDESFDSDIHVSDEETSTCSEKIELRLSCIEEERFTCGIADPVELILDNTKDECSVLPLRVVRVVNPHTIVVAPLLPSSTSPSQPNIYDAVEMILKGCASLKNVKKSMTVRHLPFHQMLDQPKLAQANGCLPPKKDRAISMAVFAAFRAAENIEHIVADVVKKKQISAVSTVRRMIRRTFRDRMITFMKSMGIPNPLTPLKQKGSIGNDTVAHVSSNFLVNMQARIDLVQNLSASGNFTGVNRIPIHTLQCPATVSVIGALASQEAIKACTGIHTPLDQMFMFESLESIIPSSSASSKVTSSKSKGGSNVPTSNIYGNYLAKRLANMNVFVVGAGAIGCELLKTLALMNVGTNRGCITVTDMDEIERSNLNRQLLFREQHLGNSKSITAAKVIKTINPEINCKGLTNKVSEETEDVFNGSFWDGVDVTLTALDNVDARMYIDKQCVLQQKWLVDSGTLGTKGNTQIVVPYVTESYASSADPPETGIPMCTLKSFPYQPEHCIGYAKALFDQLFNNDPILLKTVLEDPSSSVLNTLPQEDISRLMTTLLDLQDDKGSRKDLMEKSAEWAICLFNRLFYKDIKDLLTQHPVDEIDEDGLPFWGGARRIPTPIMFDKNDTNHKNFVMAAAKLRGRLYMNITNDDYYDYNENMNISIIGDENRSNFSAENASHRSLFKLLKTIKKSQRKLLSSKLYSEEFDKDDISLGHVDFVAATAHLRSAVYSLKTVSQLEVRRVAGRIVPAIATTTALVSGLVCLEVLKIAGERKKIIERKGGNDDPVASVDEKENERLLDRYKNSFVNLALPMLASTQPVPAEMYKLPLRSKVGNSENDTGSSSAFFTMWDILEAPSTVYKCTLAMISTELNAKYDVVINSLSWGDYPLYAEYLVDGDERYALTVAEAIEAAMDDCEDEIGDGLDEEEDGFVDQRAGTEGTDSNERENMEARWKMAKSRGYIDLDATTSTDESLQIPPIRVYFQAKPKTTQNAALDRDSALNKGKRMKRIGHGFAERLKKLRSNVQKYSFAASRKDHS